MDGTDSKIDTSVNIGLVHVPFAMRSSTRKANTIGPFDSAEDAGAYAKRLWPDEVQDEGRTGRGGISKSRSRRFKAMDYPYVYYWNRQGRKGQFCRVTARGKHEQLLCRVSGRLQNDHQPKRNTTPLTAPTHSKTS